MNALVGKDQPKVWYVNNEPIKRFSVSKSEVELLEIVLR